jgi:toluene monooxygenase system protein E
MIPPQRHRATWEDGEAWQPLRELIEHALVTYEWGEALVALDLVIKPRLDRLVNEEIFGALAAANADPILRNIHFSLDEDARWHRQSSFALLATALGDTPANAKHVSRWVGQWAARATAAIDALAGCAAAAPVADDPVVVAARVNKAAEEETSRARHSPARKTIRVDFLY